MMGYSPNITVRSVPPGRSICMVLARSSRAARLDHRLLEPGRRHQGFELVRGIDHHEHSGARVARLLEPSCEQQDVKTDQHVGSLDRLQRALATPDSRDADLGP